MTTLKNVSAQITINASKNKVWGIWSKFSNVADYIASVPKSTFALKSANARKASPAGST